MELPGWFEALNGSIHYQLTCVGGHAPVYIAEEVRANRFRIAGGRAGLKVCWQVTGIRHDPAARAHPVMVEMEKHATERGSYQDPLAHGQPGEKRIGASRQRAATERVQEHHDRMRHNRERLAHRRF